MPIKISALTGQREGRPCWESGPLPWLPGFCTGRDGSRQDAKTQRGDFLKRTKEERNGMKKIGMGRVTRCVLLGFGLAVLCSAPHVADSADPVRVRTTLVWSNPPAACPAAYVTGLKASTNLVHWEEVVRLPYSNGLVTVVLTNRPAGEFYRAFNGLAL